MKLDITQKDINFAYNKLLDKSRLDFGFVMLAVISLTICILGFIINSASVIIGSMLVSPLLYPLLSIPATLFRNDYKFFIRKSVWIVVSIIILVLYALVLFSLNEILYINNIGSEITERVTAHIFIYLLIALASGAGGAVSLFWPHVAEAVAGVAISVALLPPIAIVGFSITVNDFNMFKTASLILLINFIGILIGSSLIIFILKKFKK